MTMKNSIKYITALALCCSLFMNAQENDMQKAIEKGKADLIEVLMKTGKDFDFGIDPAAVKQSRGVAGIPYREMDFKKLLEYSGQGMDAILSPTQKLVVPLVNGTNVVTTLSIAEEGKGRYKVTEVINQQYQNELNMLPAEAKQNDFKNLTIIYVPNLNTVVYTADGKSYTSYNGNSLREGQDPEMLMQEFKIDAVDFQQKYGDLIKKGKLVN